jgi:hypothetical protein
MYFRSEGIELLTVKLLLLEHKDDIVAGSHEVYVQCGYFRMEFFNCVKLD